MTTGSCRIFHVRTIQGHVALYERGRLPAAGTGLPYFDAPGFRVCFPFQVPGLSRSILVLDAMLIFLMAGTLRMGMRSFYVANRNPRGLEACGLPEVRAWLKGRRRVIIVGAGASGEKIPGEIIENPQLDFCVAAFIDDDPIKIGRKLKKLA